VYSQPAALEARGGDEQTDVWVRPIAELLRDPLPSWKRLLDIAGALVLLVLTLPMIVLGAVLVRLSSPGPVIFRQRRAGLHGQPFAMFKFRTMVHGAEAMKLSLLQFNELKGAIFKMKNDPRITRIGRFLRVTSIDELPQLWNVLRGEMSLVGPRPPTLDEVGNYRAWHRRRLSVRPGITGLWQVSARECNDFDDRVRMDLRYIERRSLLGDLRLLGATVPTVLSRRGAM
jgi:lipopolysaccharide/colanic/teichoic acid biosynthesis glycosyltransferase